MTDKTTLPERLRKLAAGWHPSYPLARDTVTSMKEAADEIERLRRALNPYEDWDQHHSECEGLG